MSGSTLTAPAGFTTLVDGYWTGTQQSWVLTGPWSDDLTVTADQSREFAYAAVAVRGAVSVTAGTVKDRIAEPAESTTVTAPAVERGTGDLAIGIAFERTSATETPEQVTVNTGWTIEHYTAQGTNIQTTLIGTGGTGDMVVTYPNAQVTNGAGVQVVAHATGSTPVDTSVDTFLATRPFYVAHRLGGTEYPEHTMQGMNAAIGAGFTAFEFSTYQTRDGVFIGSHDWTTERTTGQLHEIWDTDWSTIQTLDQQAGPIIRLEDAVAAMPEGSVLVLDHKATSASSTYHEGNRRSEAELFDLLDTLFDNPTERVIWKLFAGADSDQRAAERGYKTMCMLYPDEVADADLSRWDILGMEYNAPQETWDTLLATGKPTIAHIIINSGQAATGLSRGAHGLMSSVPGTVFPLP